MLLTCRRSPSAVTSFDAASPASQSTSRAAALRRRSRSRTIRLQTANNGIGLLLWTVDGSTSISGGISFTGTDVPATSASTPWDGTAIDAMNVTITGGSISGYADRRPPHELRGLWPYGASPNDATLTLSGVDIATATAARACRSRTTPAAAARSTSISRTTPTSPPRRHGHSGERRRRGVSVTDNDDSINGNAMGIDVNGGSATITNNHLFRQRRRHRVPQRRHGIGDG